MSDDEELELVRGSGNVYRDLNMPDANIRQTKGILAAAIIGVLDERELSNSAAAGITGVDHADFSRIRNAQFRRFTIDRLMSILNRLDEGAEVTVRVQLSEQTGSYDGSPGKVTVKRIKGRWTGVTRDARDSRIYRAIDKKVGRKKA